MDKAYIAIAKAKRIAPKIQFFFFINLLRWRRRIIAGMRLKCKGGRYGTVLRGAAPASNCRKSCELERLAGSFGVKEGLATRARSW
jgi:hypothetical protein